MPSPQYDLTYLEAALEVLEDYLESPETYWNLGIAPPPGEDRPYPQMSLGNVLFALQRLQRPLEPVIEARRERIAQRLDALRQKHPVLWNTKANREAQMRARLWAQYIDELAEEASARAYYPSEVRHRAVLEVLYDHAEIEGEVQALQAHADRRLQTRWEPGPFVWEEEVAPAFPKDRFWFLYGRPR